LIYQPYYPGGTNTYATVAVSNGSNEVTTPNTYALVNGKIFDFTDLYSLDKDVTEYIVVVSLNHFVQINTPSMFDRSPGP
jgi:hypothetical protein